MNKIKIAIITYNQHWWNVGGIEKYLRICYEGWKNKNYEITEFFTYNQKNIESISKAKKFQQIKLDNQLVGWYPSNVVWGGTYNKKKMRKIYDEFDIVLIHSHLPPQRWLKNKKTVLIQHGTKGNYDLFHNQKFSDVFVKFFTTILFGAGTIRNAFKFANNGVFYCEETFIDNKNNAFFIPIATFKKHQMINETPFNQKKQFTFIGRLSNQQKNIKALVELANLNPDIVIYGHGEDYKIIDKHLINPKQFKGSLSSKKINYVFKNSKCLIMTSNYEGFGLVIVEALSKGVPVILFDTFEAIKFLKKSNAVFPVQRGNIEYFNQTIKWLRNLPENEYQKISDNAILFAKEYLSKETFWRRWDEVINKVVEPRKIIELN